MDKPQLFSSKDSTWGTPKWLFDILNDIFKFSVDVCANYKNFKMAPYIGEYEFKISDDDSRFIDCLKISWKKYGNSFFMNPPYGKQIKLFTSKAIEEISQLEITGYNSSAISRKCVMLLPSRTDTGWFHKLLKLSYCDIRFIKGRLYFEDENRVEFKNAAIFPSCLAFLNCEKKDIDNAMEKIHNVLKLKKTKKKRSVFIKLIHVSV